MTLLECVSFTFAGFVVDERGKRELVVYECDATHGFCYGQLCCGLRMRRSSEVWRTTWAEHKLKH